MKQNILTGVVLVLGVVAGVGLVELGLRALAPQLLAYPEAERSYVPADELVYAPGEKLIVKPAGGLSGAGPETHEILFNQYGYRDSKDIADSTRGDWVVYGGSIAFGLGVSMDEWFGTRYSRDNAPKVYNAAFVGGSNYLEPMVDHAFGSGAKAGRAAFVIDMSQHPDILLNQKQSFDAHQEEPAAAESSFLQRLALARALGLADAPAQNVPPLLTMREAMNIARAMQPALAPYTSERERNVVLLVPARGYWLDNAYGTAHRKNQEVMGRALRGLKNVYVVDISYMMRQNRANPLDFYYDNGRLKPEAHGVLSSGWERQVKVFEEWKPFEELTPAQQEQVRKQREEMRREREERRRKNIFAE